MSRGDAVGVPPAMLAGRIGTTTFRAEMTALPRGTAGEISDTAGARQRMAGGRVEAANSPRDITREPRDASNSPPM